VTASRPITADTIGLLEGLITTRAIRRYTDEDIPEDALRDILFAATRAPSGSNRQPFRFVVLRKGARAMEARRLIAEAARRTWRGKSDRDGYDEGSGARTGTPKARMADTMTHYVEHYESVPVIVLACYVPYREPQRLIDGGSVYPACQNLLLAARALGYGGVLTGFASGAGQPLRDLLGIPEHVVLAGTITLGRPAGSHGTVRRRPMAEAVDEDAWGSPAPWAVDPPGTRFTAAGPPGTWSQGPTGTDSREDAS
jgi:nitroreductase